MQTFLPLPDYELSARVLDRQRLGKQRLEARQIIRVLLGARSPWAHHPAVLMWCGHAYSLAQYGIAVCREWLSRGYEDHQMEWFETMARVSFVSPPPPWLGRADFHASHRSNLLRKNPVWYGRFGWAESPDLPYVWPVQGEEHDHRNLRAVEVG